MNKKEKDQIAKIIESLDGAVGHLVVPAMKDKTIKTAMESVSQASFLLGLLIE